mmetsp:Transcript_7132/g.20894  ORF Transcript_7132/g.20894 Transcript_7132/m.20894 type:complete len:151 (+) Transcript_7132:184-636(+)
MPQPPSAHFMDGSRQSWEAPSPHPPGAPLPGGAAQRASADGGPGWAAPAAPGRVPPDRQGSGSCSRGFLAAAETNGGRLGYGRCALRLFADWHMPITPTIGRRGVRGSLEAAEAGEGRRLDRGMSDSSQLDSSAEAAVHRIMATPSWKGY